MKLGHLGSHLGEQSPCEHGTWVLSWFMCPMSCLLPGSFSSTTFKNLIRAKDAQEAAVEPAVSTVISVFRQRSALESDDRISSVLFTHFNAQFMNVYDFY